MARTRQTKGNGLTLLGILAGVVLGAAVALFYTPDNGEENRRHMAEWLANRAEQVQEKAQSQLSGSS
jgi:gas vesicle protein